MGTADDGHPGIAQPTGIAPLLTVGHGIAHIGEVLVTVAAHQLMVRLAVEPEAVFALEFCFTDAHAHHAAVGGMAFLRHGDFHLVEVWVFGRPQLWSLQRGAQYCGLLCSCCQFQCFLHGGHHLAVAVFDACGDGGG